MRSELSVKEVQYRIYEKRVDNYTASCVLNFYGNKCWMSNIHGKEFWEQFKKDYMDLAIKYNVTSFEGCVTKAHYRLIRRILKDTPVELIIETMCSVSNHELLWLIIKVI